MPNLDGLDPQLRSIVEKILQESGGKVTVSSGYRSRAEQQRLYDLYKSGKGNLAAKPGSSMHEHGGAVDFGGDLQLAAKLAAKYGLHASVPGEPWHFVLGEGGMEVSNGEYDLGGQQNPQDVLGNRLHAILRMLGTDAVGMNDVTSPGFGDQETDDAFNIEFQSPEEAGQAVLDVGQSGTIAEGAKGKLQQYAMKQMPAFGLDPKEIGQLITLWNKESGWNPNAQNPTSTAFGIAQFLNGTWAGTGYSKTSDPHKQIEAGLQYIKGRYGSVSNALAFHLKNNWY